MITQEQIKNKLQSDLNALAIELGYVDENSQPLYSFYGVVSTFDNYNWIKSIEVLRADNTTKYLRIIPFALVRTASTPSYGEKINERVDEYTFFCHIIPEAKEDIRNIFEEYMFRENDANNPGLVEDNNVLKQFTNFVIDDETLAGAPDGMSRHQTTLQFTYDIFENTFINSKDYTLLIDGVEVPYYRWRFEKSNMTIANSDNTATGINLTNLDKLHDYSLVVNLYNHKTLAPLIKIRKDLFSKTLTNVKYSVQIKLLGEVIFSDDMILPGGETFDQPPRLSTLDVTFAPSYRRIGLEFGILGTTDSNGNQVYENIPVAAYNFGHNAVLYTSAYNHDNSSKSNIIGLAKGFSVSFNLKTEGSPIMHAILEETLRKIYTRIYTCKITFLDIVVIYNYVIQSAEIGSDDAAYDILKVSFVEAK